MSPSNSQDLQDSSNTQSTNEGQSSGLEENPANNPPNDTGLVAGCAPPRQPRTHTSPAVVQMFKSLTLRFKLMKCKDIERQNDERNWKSLNHASDPVSHPEPGSEAASMFTIDEEDLERLQRPSYASLFKDVMPTFLTNFLADHVLPEASENKRESESFEDQRIVKRRCMDGSRLQPRTVDAPLDIQFTQLLYETEDCGMVPLPLFLNSSLEHLSVNGANVPTFKANPKFGEKKGFTIIDCKKLLASLGLAELKMTHAEWSEAAVNCFRFQSSRDIGGSGGGFSSWWEKHFNFFNLQKDKVVYYDAWKAMELQLRQEFYSQPTLYDPAFYAQKYGIIKTSFDLETKFQSLIPGPSKSSSSFPSSSSKSSATPCCVLCGERGHTLFSHAGSTSSSKFADGRPTFARYVNKVLRSPDGKEICIRWNVRNSASCADHGKERVHICSFCGGLHYAFSWTCRAKPAEL